MSEINCKECNKEFGSEDALSMHNKSKHYEEIKKPMINSKRKKKIKNWIYIILVIGVVFGLIYFVGSNSEVSHPSSPLDIYLEEHSQVGFHIHPFLEIEILGEKQIIPANIGITNSGMRVIHTHDSSGKLHIESPSPMPIYLKYFFTIWDKQFNQTCILDYCTDDSTSLTMFVNGVENNQYGDYVLQDGDIVKIVYQEIF